MTVTCAICGRSMSNINNRHLATHNITAAQYKQRFPDSALSSPEHAAKLSARSVKANAGRKGVSRTAEDIARMREGQRRYQEMRTDRSRGPMSESQKQVLSSLAHERFAQGFVHPNLGKHHSEQTKERIRQSLQGRTVGPVAALKAIATKRAAGYDLAPFRGRTHTDQTKALIRAAALDARKVNRLVMLDRMSEANVVLLNPLDADLFELRCNVCGHEFTRTPQCFHPSKFHREVCDQCFPRPTISAGENEVASLVAQLTDSRVIRSDRSVLERLELDIYVPAAKLAIEYSGLYYRSEAAGKPQWYHRYKYDACQRAGIRLITIFEDEWINRRAIVESMLRHTLGRADRVLNARACKVGTLDPTTAARFLNDNHIQGRGRSSVRYGLIYQDELVAVMTFSLGELSRRQTGWEINRYCSKLGHSIRGAASKLFAAFLRDHAPKQVTSYADLRWGTGAVYGRMGFELVGVTVPGYWYVKPNELKRYHRYSLRKQADEPHDVPEHALRAKAGYARIWDCGHGKWVYRHQ